MHAGATYGFTGMVEGILRAISIQLNDLISDGENASPQAGRPIPFVATGGYAALIVPRLGGVFDVRPNLNLEGLSHMAAHALAKGKLGA
jgi:pantothenate kinase type III